MEILLNGISKRYNRTTIFRDVTRKFSTGNSYAITGRNGSGKSTLLQVISGFITPTSGEIVYRNSSRQIMPEDFYKYIAVATPYLELPEEFSFQETLQNHFRFHPIEPGYTINGIIDLSGLGTHRHKELKYYSSGMRQRVKLCLALFSSRPILLLDEPAGHLDDQGLQWYLDKVKNVHKTKLVIISSNQPSEYAFCSEVLKMEEFKKERV